MNKSRYARLSGDALIGWPSLLLLAAMVFTVPLTAHAANAFLDQDNSFPSGIVTAPDSGKEWQALDERIAKIDASIIGDTAEDEQKLLSLQREVEALKSSIVAYVGILDSDVKQLNSELATLGAPVQDEPSSVTEQRKSVQDQKGQLEGKLVGYRLLLLHSDTLIKKLSDLRQKLLTEEFFARGTLTLLSAHTDLAWRWIGASWNFITERSGLQELSLTQLSYYAILIMLAAGVGVLLRHRYQPLCVSPQDDTYHYALRLFSSLTQYAPHLLVGVMTAALAQLVFSSNHQLFVYHFGITLPLFFASWALLHFLFRSQGDSVPALSISGRLSRGLGRSLKLAVLVGYIGHLAFNTGAMADAAEEAHLVARDVCVLMLVLSLLWTNHYLRRLMNEHGVRGIGGLLAMVLLGALVAEVIGYRNIAYWVLRALIGSGLILFFTWLLVHLLKELFDSLRLGRMWWQQGLRKMLGYGVDESMPWLDWVFLPAAGSIWVGGAYVVMLVWGISNESITQLSKYLLEGFQVGSLTIIPLRIVIAVVVFAILLAISGWVRGRLESKWLKKSRMERGTREAMVTISGYVGVALAILVALGVAGVQFTNLAIIAGALSVGIGFGLQNIVNNFVSGLILLFERPVKTGDWIMVGSTEGYVKRISIRSTLIQTFDRADVIVPNSELISGQVTNWMLYDPRGRIRVPVGVAYGSDTEKVKSILLAIAAEHPSVITDGSMTEPKVLFLSFGESSLDFELRAFIKNIDERLQVISDMNFAIDAAFRREGIEIPFPQRDLHVRDWPSKPQD